MPRCILKILTTSRLTTRPTCTRLPQLHCRWGSIQSTPIPTPSSTTPISIRPIHKTTCLPTFPLTYSPSILPICRPTNILLIPTLIIPPTYRRINIPSIRLATSHPNTFLLSNTLSIPSTDRLIHTKCLPPRPNILLSIRRSCPHNIRNNRISNSLHNNRSLNTLTHIR